MDLINYCLFYGSIKREKLSKKEWNEWNISEKEECVNFLVDIHLYVILL